jgi:hypothetical protein
VKVAHLGVEALADHRAVADHDGSDERVGADAAATALGKLARAFEMGPIRVCEPGCRCPGSHPD